MNESAARELYKVVVDKSHKYTNVYASDYIGPGNAHHNYDIVHKEEGKLDRWLAEVRFQDGPIKEVGINGIMDENLLAIVIDRLQGFQSGDYKSRYNAIAMTKIEEALMWLQKRTRDREARGVEGTHKV